MDSSIPCHPSIPQKHIPTLVTKVEDWAWTTVQQLLRCSWLGKILMFVKSNPHGSLEFPLQWLSQAVTRPRLQFFQGLGTHHFFKHIHTQPNSTYLGEYNRKFFLVRTNLLPQNLRTTENKFTFLFHKTLLLILEDYYLGPSRLFFSYPALFLQTSRFRFPIAIHSLLNVS